MSESLWPSLLIDFSSIVQEQVGKLQHEIGNFMKNARLHGIYVSVGGELLELHVKPLVSEDLAVKQFEKEKTEKNGDRINSSKGEWFEYQRISKNYWNPIEKINETNEYFYNNDPVYDCTAKVKGEDSGVIFCCQDSFIIKHFT